MDREPSTQPISKLEFEFERKKLTKDDVRELIYREVSTIFASCSSIVVSCDVITHNGTLCLKCSDLGVSSTDVARISSWRRSN